MKQSLLTRLAEAAEAGGRNGRLIEILVLQALALQAQNNTAHALMALGKSLSLGEPEGYVRIFVDEGAALATLLKLGIEHGIWSDSQLIRYVNRLLEAFIDDSMAQNLAEDHVPGAVVVIVKNGEVLLAKGYGYADVDRKIP